ncbi:MAG: glycoside hydrolase family 25 protein [Marinibacterium sp.]
MRYLPSLWLTFLLAACGQPGLGPGSGTIGPQGQPAGRFRDYDPHPWQGHSPEDFAVHGIDVARYQGDIDWRRVKGAGVAFAYVKATEGGDILDPEFKTNWRNAARAGVPRGAYHYFYFCRPAAEQAQWFIRHVPRDPNALPPVLDMEWNHTSPTCRKRPSSAVVRAEAEHFLRILQAHYGKRPVLYTTVDFYRDTYIGRLKGADFWLRSVAGPPQKTYPGQGWRLWQYTGTGVVPGVKGPVDINVFRGSPEAFATWAGRT